MRKLLILFLLTSCGPVEYDAHWREGNCTRSHYEVQAQFTNECGLSLDGHYDCEPRLKNVQASVCDEREPPVCEPGSDGVADCA